MFAGTPKLRDVLDLRSVLLVGAVALCAIGVQGLVLAGTVAVPLGDAVVRFDRADRMPDAPAEALAIAPSGTELRVSTPGGETLPWAIPIVAAAEYRIDPAGICPR